jgi:hypothetical protein
MKAKFAIEEKVVFLIHRQTQVAKGKKPYLGAGTVTGISVSDDDKTITYEVLSHNGDKLIIPEPHIYKVNSYGEAVAKFTEQVEALTADAPPVEA